MSGPWMDRKGYLGDLCDCGGVDVKIEAVGETRDVVLRAVSADHPVADRLRRAQEAMAQAKALWDAVTDLVHDVGHALQNGCRPDGPVDAEWMEGLAAKLTPPD